MGHEDFCRQSPVRGSSDRSFGIVIAGFFAILGLLPLFWGDAVRWWALAAAAVFCAAALAAPRLLAPLNRQWTRLGLLLHRIVSPLVLGIMFFGMFMPIGLLMRISGKDPLRLRADPDARSYWIERIPPGPAAESLKNQF
jgi:hypothetical protein